MSGIVSYTFLVPPISLIAGVLFLIESFTLYILAGLCLIVTTIKLVNYRPKVRVDTELTTMNR